MSKEKKELNLNCPVVYTLSILGGKWKWLIIYMLFEHQLLRYGELKRKLVGITHKMLSQQLKELEAEKLLNRKEYQQIPPKVEYSLTEKGQTLLPIINSMCEWAKIYSQKESK
ncbi:winged helix-turn-helix transcriptional regulator [Succinispira mobilis]|uniref:winged helix-turn-helix transcriptional regulator n=1 Tax=Succinispira mobilis TaxID=78120 RepID=UPI000380427C|nr:helix-turn-helix domain-containing protein [Succinispira mobilis]